MLDNKHIQKNVIALIAVLIIMGSLFVTLEVFSRTSNLKWYSHGKVTQGEVDVCVDIPPVIPLIGNWTAYVDEVFDRHILSYDNEGDDVYFYDDSILFNITETGGRILFTPVESQRGDYDVMITVTDKVCEGVNVSQVFNLIVNASRLVLDNIPNLTATEDLEFIYDINASGGDVPYVFSSNESWFVIDSDNRMINLTANNSLVGNHRVLVQVDDNGGRIDEQVVNFSVANINDAPFLDMNEDGVRDLMLNQTMNENDVFYYDVNATDLDLEIPNSSEKLVFQDNSGLFVINEDTGIIYFDEGDESYVGNNTIFISVSDGEVIDAQKVTFEILWENDAPSLTMSTALTHYIADGNFTYDMFLNDEEDGGEDTLNMSIVSNLTSMVVNITTGVCFMEVDDSMVGDVYNINFTLNDSYGLETSKILSLSIVSINRAPVFDYYSPSDLNQTIEETESVQFDVVARDPDGNEPSLLWYVDETSVGVVLQNYTYSTGYDSSGLHNISVFASDGNLSAALEWNVSVIDKARPVVPPSTGGSSGGGGGGGGGSVCTPIWICSDWSICQQTAYSMECMMDYVREDECGVQNRTCIDIKNCRSSFNKPDESQMCIFTGGAGTCYDGVLNQGEFGIDCGGPCSPCATCHDGVLNQGEEGIDCGGPCSPCEGVFKVPEISGWVTTFGFGGMMVLLFVVFRLLYVKVIKKYVVVYSK